MNHANSLQANILNIVKKGFSDNLITRIAVYVQAHGDYNCAYAGEENNNSFRELHIHLYPLPAVDNAAGIYVIYYVDDSVCQHEIVFAGEIRPTAELNRFTVEWHDLTGEVVPVRSYSQSRKMIESCLKQFSLLFLSATTAEQVAALQQEASTVVSMRDRQTRGG